MRRNRKGPEFFPSYRGSFVQRYLKLKDPRDSESFLLKIGFRCIKFSLQRLHRSRKKELQKNGKS